MFRLLYGKFVFLLHSNVRDIKVPIYPINSEDVIFKQNSAITQIWRVF
jgi:hypothetical protein